MNKQIFIDGKYEYDLVQDGNTFYLYYSDNDAWSDVLVGKLALSVVYDDDCNFTFSPLPGDKIDCSTAEQMLILLEYTSDNRIYEITEKNPL